MADWGKVVGPIGVVSCIFSSFLTCMLDIDRWDALSGFRLRPEASITKCEAAVQLDGPATNRPCRPIVILYHLKDRPVLIG